MNTNLLNILKQVAASQGEAILSDHKRVNSFLSDLARDVPKPQKNALVRCLEHGFAQTLKDAAESERSNIQQRLAQQLHDEEGLDLGLCGETLELLAAVLFGEEQKQQENRCTHCGKELQEGWKTCPFCSTPVAAVGFPNASDTPKAADEKSEYNVILLAFDEDKKIDVIREIRAVTGMGLKEAKDLVEGAPNLIKGGVSKKETAEIKFLISAAGGTVEIQPVSTSDAQKKSEPQYDSAQQAQQQKWVCSVCGYVHTGSNAPNACPQCKAPAAKFQVRAGQETTEPTPDKPTEQETKSSKWGIEWLAVILPMVWSYLFFEVLFDILDENIVFWVLGLFLSFGIPLWIAKKKKK